MADPSGGDGSSGSALSVSASLSRMRTGASFLMWQRDASGQPAARRVLLFLREGSAYGRAGCLCWSLTQTLTEMPAQRLQLHQLVDMRCGKLSPLFVEPALTARVDDARCFTLRSQSKELNLEAPSHEIRELWWKGILHKLEQAGRQLVNNAAAAAAVANAAADPSPSPSSTSYSQHQLQTPYVPNTPQSQNAPSASSSSLRSPQPPHAALTPVSSSSGGRSSPSSHSHSQSHSNSHLLHYQQAQATSSPQPPQMQSVAPLSAVSIGPPVSGGSSSSSSSSSGPRESTPQELRALMSAGVVLRKYDLVDSSLRLTHVVLFAEGSGRSGSLYWLERSAAHPAAFSPLVSAAERAAPLPPLGSEQRVPLELITDFMLRKKSPALRHATGHADCCFALVYGPEARSLNLEAASPAICKAVKEAIITMLTTAGKQVVKASSGSSASSASSSASASAASAAAASHAASSSAATSASPYSYATPNSVPRRLPPAGTPSTPASTSSSASSSSAYGSGPFAAAPPSPAPPSSSFLPGNALLAHGARFMLYSTPPSATAAGGGSAQQQLLPSCGQEIFLWLQAPHDPANPASSSSSSSSSNNSNGVERPGALCYAILSSPSAATPPQRKCAPYPGQVHWLGGLRQMQLGKECGPFKQLSLSHLLQDGSGGQGSGVPHAFLPSVRSGALLNPSCCMSIVFKAPHGLPPTTLHLEALGPLGESAPPPGCGLVDPARESVREPFIKALHAIMVKFTSEEKERKKAAALAAAAASAAAAVAAPLPATPAPYLAPDMSGAGSGAGSGSSAQHHRSSPGLRPTSISPAPPELSAAPVPHPSLLRGVPFTLYTCGADPGQGQNEVSARRVLVCVSQGSSGKFALYYLDRDRELGAGSGSGSGYSDPPSAQELALLPPHQRLSLSSITRVVAGKAGTGTGGGGGAFRSLSPLVHALPPERCVSVQSKAGGEWSMVAEDTPARDAFMRNLHQTMLKYRKQSSAAAAATAGAAAAAGANGGGGGVAAPAPVPAPAPAAVPAEAASPYAGLPVPDLDFLSRGHACRLFHPAPPSWGGGAGGGAGPVAEEGVLHFQFIPFAPESLAQAPGVLLFTPTHHPAPVSPRTPLRPLSCQPWGGAGSGRAGAALPPASSVPESRRLQLNRMSQLVGGKETPTMQHAYLATLELDRCFSVFFAPPPPPQLQQSASSSSSIGAAAPSLGEWNIECGSTALREAWVHSLHAVMVRFAKDRAEYKAHVAATAAAAAAAQQQQQDQPRLPGAAAASGSTPPAAADQFLSLDGGQSDTGTMIPLSNGGGGGGRAAAAADATIALERLGLDRDTHMDLGMGDTSPSVVMRDTACFGGGGVGDSLSATKLFGLDNGGGGGGGGGGGSPTPSPSPQGSPDPSYQHEDSSALSPRTGSPRSSGGPGVFLRSPKSSGSASDFGGGHGGGGGGGAEVSLCGPRSSSTNSASSSSQSSSRSAQHALSQESDAAAALLVAGQYFSLFTSTGEGKEVTRAEIFLYLQSSTGADAPGSLVWLVVPAAQAASGVAPLPAVRQAQVPPRNRFALGSIRQMRSGKVSPQLSSAVAAGVPNECCLSLANDAMTLNLAVVVPASPGTPASAAAGMGMEARDGFMRAVHALVVQNGMKAKVESVEGTAAGGGVGVGAASSTQPVRSVSAAAAAGGAPASSAAARPGPGHGHSHSHSVDRSHRLAPNFASAAINKTISFSDPTSLFVLQHKIGEGSYGAVYRALDLRDGKLVAVKIIPFNGADSSKLRNEIRVLRGCDSPHVIAYRGAFQKAEQVWIVMEFCSGGSLADMMHVCRHTFSENQIAVVMRQTLLGLKYLHTMAGEKKIIIHRDIKGGNILVSEDGKCKLADFGVSGTLDQSLGKHRTVIGTPHWMAPECLLSDNYTELVDIWSLGITAYELAVGQPPHAELHSLRAALKIPQAEPPTLPHPERFSPELHSFLRSCLVKDYTRRPSAAELLNHPFIVGNQSTPAILLDMVARTRSAIEAKTAAANANAGSGAGASSVSSSSAGV